MSLLGVLQREPVRVYLYGVLLATLALLVGLGVVTAAVAPLIVALITAVLAVPAVEVARAKVSPTATVGYTDGTGVVDPDEVDLGAEDDEVVYDPRTGFPEGSG